MERVSVNAQAVSQKPGTLARTVAPILLALSANAGVTMMGEWQHRYLSGIVDQLDQTHHTRSAPSARPETFADPQYLMDITIESQKYRTVLSGLCFNEGDDVNAVVDAKGTLLAVARPDHTALSIYSSCKYGFGQFMQHQRWSGKLLFWMMMIPALFIDAGELLLNGSWDLTVFLSVLAAAPFVLLGVTALVCGLANRDDFMPAWLASSIFEALSRPDLATANFDLAERKAPHDGRKRPGDKGRVLYFWPLERVSDIARPKADAVSPATQRASRATEVEHSEG